MALPLLDIRKRRVYVCCVYNIYIYIYIYIYTFLYSVFIYFSCNEQVRDASIVFGTVQSDRTGSLATQIHYVHLRSFCNAVSIMNYTFANMSESNIMVCQQFVHHFQVGLWRLISHQYWLSFASYSFGLLCVMFFSLILVAQANGVEGWTTSTAWLYHQCN